MEMMKKAILLIILVLPFTFMMEDVDAALTSGPTTVNVCASQYATYAGSGYIIESKQRVSYGRCSVKFNLRRPSTGGSTTNACLQSVIPSGFITMGTGTTPSCDQDGGTGPNGTYYIIRYLSDSLTFATVCHDNMPQSTVPPGWVVTGISSSYSCGGSYPTMSIRKATESSYFVCDNTTTPPGYVITGGTTRNYSGCNNGPAYRITRNIQSGMQVCDSLDFVLPAGYVITGRGSNPGCSYGGITLTSLNSISSTLICDSLSGINIPDGYMPVERGNYINCAEGSATGPGTQIEKMSSSMSVCSLPILPEFPALPTGYVISGITNTLSCAGGNTWQISNTLAPGQVVCYPSSVPQGWVYESSGLHSQCAPGSGKGYGYMVVAALASGSFACSDSPIPSGWVSTGDYNATGCIDGIARSISIPNQSGSTDICYPSEVPDGFVLVAMKSDTSTCTGRKTISKPSQTGATFICPTSPIPDQYAVTSFVPSTPQCSSYGQGYMISLISGAGPYYLCLPYSVPVGYVITEMTNHCNIGTSPGYAIVAPNPSGTTMCVTNYSPVPTDFVIVGVSNSSQCGSSNLAYSIKHPNPTGITYICKNSESTIPDGYVTVSSSASGSCGTLISTAITPIGELAPYPFINVEADVKATDVAPVTYDCSGFGVSLVFRSTASANSAQCF